MDMSGVDWLSVRIQRLRRVEVGLIVDEDLEMEEGRWVTAWTKLEGSWRIKCYGMICYLVRYPTLVEVPHTGECPFAH